MIVGRLIPAGTGLAYHAARKNVPPAQLFEDAPEAETPAPAAPTETAVENPT